MTKRYPQHEARFTIYCDQCNSVAFNEHQCQPTVCSKCSGTEWKRVANGPDVYCQGCGRMREEAT